MLGILITSLLLTEKWRWIAKFFSQKVQMNWNEWEIRALVVLSLVLQVLLIFLGGRRKYDKSVSLRIFLWVFYLSADTVATICLAALSRSQGQTGSMELMVLWAPFLLLHLGGPDTITAYSLEDNELWLRHLLQLVQQVFIAIYVLYSFWAYSRVSILTIFMFIPGIIKYGERTWVLWLASKDKLRDSMLTPPEAGSDYADFMNKYASKQAKGSRHTVERIGEVELRMEEDPASPCRPDLPDAEVLPEAYEFFKIFKLLFADLILSGHDWETSRKIFQGSSTRRAFKVIEVELGFMYDLLYSKAALVYSKEGLILRLINFLSIITLLVAFLMGDNHRYSHTDVVITYVLFIGALILEICAVFFLIFSDWAFLWLTKRREHILVLVSNALEKRLSSRKRWSNLVAQYNLISVCLKEESPQKLPKKVQSFPFIGKSLDGYNYTYYEEVRLKSKELIYQELKRKSRKVAEIEDVKNMCTSRGDGVLEKNSHIREKLQWSLNDVEFDQSILLWHIATDLCYECDNDISHLTDLQRNTSKLLSDYMLYLFMMCPSMLPEGIGQIRFRDTRAEAERFFKQTKSEFDKIKACEKLLEVNTDIRPVEVKGDRSKSVLFDACRLAKTLQSLKEENFGKWEIVSLVWIEMLSYAATQCKGTNHARQLGRGGEFITHIWLLMAHLGIAELFQISQGHVRAMLISG